MLARIGRRTVLGALATLVVASACSSERGAVSDPGLGEDDAGVSTPATPLDTPVRTVAMVGDSITVGATPQLEDAFAVLELDVLAIDAEEGRRIAESTGELRSGVDASAAIAANTPPDLWVIALGTNDVTQYTAGAYGPVISDLLAQLPPDAPLVWVDVYSDAAVDASREFNTVLSSLLGDRPGAVVAPWSAVASADGVLADGVHPGEAGKEQFAATVADAVAAARG